jgi:hypothetical protein
VSWMQSHLLIVCWNIGTIPTVVNPFSGASVLIACCPPHAQAAALLTQLAKLTFCLRVKVEVCLTNVRALICLEIKRNDNFTQWSSSLLLHTKRSTQCSSSSRNRNSSGYPQQVLQLQQRPIRRI